ncbi:MAG TPA: SBBP repeat-containing protein, partial [Bryobacteraceae bacterium]|nr:SBBP repeat-containing protein [Bryobacteraceae bacterium]
MIRTIPSVLFAFFAFVLGFQPALAADPAYLWSKAFGSPTNDQGTAVATDASGNVYLTGSFTGSANIGGQNLVCGTSGDCLFLAKFAPDGTPLWSKSFNSGYASGKAVATDADGNVFLAGVFANANFGCGTVSGSIFAAKLAPDGSCLWSKPFKSVATGGSTNAGGNDAASGLAIDAGGNVFLTGKFGCSTSEGCAINFGGGLITSPQRPGYGGIFLAKLAGTDGSHQWSKAYGGVSGMDYTSGVAVDSSGNPSITGYFSSSILNLGGSNLTNAGPPDGFLAKYRGSDGAPLWSKR